MEEMRKQFEAWALSIGCSVISNHDSGYLYPHTASLWDAWQASRAALVVDIASHTEFEIEHIISPEKEGYSTGWIDGRNYSVKQVCAAGITVKEK